MPQGPVRGERPGRDAYNQQYGHRHGDWYFHTIDHGVDHFRGRQCKQHRGNYGECIDIIAHGE